MRRALAALLCLAGCKADVVRVVDVGEPINFFATFDDSGAIVRTGRLLPEDDRAQLLADDGARLWVWSYAADGVVGANGAPLDADALASVEITDGRDCSRCPFTNTGRVVLGPGHACSAGAPAAGYGPDGPIDAPPPIVFLHRDGECPAEPSETPVTGPDFEVCPLWPPQGLMHASKIAVSDTGAVAGVRESFLFHAPLVEDAAVAPTVEPHREIQGITGVAGTGEFVFAAKSQAKNDGELRFYRFGAEVTPRLAYERDFGFRSPITLHGLPHDVGHFFVVGSGAGATQIQRCSLDDGCDTESVDRSGCAMTAGIDDVAAHVSGRVLAVDARGGLYERNDNARWACRSDLIDAELFDGEIFRLRRVQGLAVLGDRWFTCGESADRTAMITGALGVDGDIAGPPHVVATLPGGTCLGIGMLPHRFDEVVVNTGDGMIIAFGNGDLYTACSPWQRCVELGIAHRPDELQYVIGPVTNGSGAAYTTDRGHVFRLEPPDRFVRVLGASLSRTPAGAIAPTDDGAVFFAPGPGPVRLRHDGAGCDGFTVEEPSSEGAWTYAVDDMTTTSTTFPGSPFEAYREAVRLEDDRYLVVGADAQRSWFVRTVDLARRHVEQRYIENERILDIARLDARRVVAVTRDRIRIVDATTLEITDPPMQWDDPSTVVEEPALAPFDGLRSVDARDGVAWIVGGRAIVRAVAFESEVRLEGWWTTSLRSEEMLDHEMQTVRVLAPDRWVAIAREPVGSDGAILGAWRMGPIGLDCPDSPAQSGGLAMCPHAAFDFGDLNAPDRAEVALGGTGPGGRITWAFSNGTVYRHGGARAVVPIERPANLVSSGDMVYVAGDGPIVGLAPRGE
ncbi:MAG: hypothetical protein RIT81_13030 [Deltaproteobacteria bacterium]